MKSKEFGKIIRVHQRWDADLVDRVNAASDELGQSVSEFTRRALEAYFSEVEEQRRAARQTTAVSRKLSKTGKGGGKAGGES